MPKIILRPNPTPPPFVPPTPPYSSQLNIVCDPLPFDNDSELAIIVSQANLPVFDLFELIGTNSNTGTSQILFSLESSDFAFNETLYVSPEGSSSSYDSFKAQFSGDGTVLLLIPAILTSAS